MVDEDTYLEYYYYSSDKMANIIDERGRLEIGGYRLYILDDCHSIRCPDGWKADIIRTACVNPDAYDELVKLLVDKGYLMSFDEWLGTSNAKNKLLH